MRTVLLVVAAALMRAPGPVNGTKTFNVDPYTVTVSYKMAPK